MSTKTTFKRIALVAVAALGLSIVSVAPSGASVNADSLNHFKAATCSAVGTIGATNVATTADAFGDCANYDADSTNVLINGTAVYGLGQSFIASNTTDAATITARLVTNAYNGTAAAVDGIAAYSAPGVLPVLTRGTYANHINANVTQTISTDGLTVTNTAAAAGSVTGAIKATFTPVLRGTYVITFTPQTGSLAKVHTWTVNAYADQAALDTANGVDSAISAAKTTSFLNAGETSTATADATVVVSKAISADAVATIVVAPKNAAGTAISSSTFALTATISGPGSLRIANTLADATASAAGRAVTGTTGHYYIGVFSDGTAGPATITISSGTTVLATETVTFYGAAASYTATVAKNVIPMGATTAAVISVVAKDKDGNVVPSQDLKMTSSDTTVVASIASGVTSSTAAQATAGTATISVIGIADKFGKVTLTFSDSTAAIAATATAVVTLSSATAKTVTLAFDKAEYTPGEKMTLKVTAVDVNGLPVASMDPIATLATNTSLFGMSSTFDTATTDGAVSYTMYAPLIAGPITLTGTDSNTAAITASTTVVSDGLAQAAVDAAEEAIAAAEAATEAALTAAEAADAATTAAQDASDAVATLATQVTEWIDALKAQNTALKAQITALTNLVIKIQKKIKA